MESKVRTTYNEVADELVSEFGNVEGTGQRLPIFHSHKQYDTYVRMGHGAWQGKLPV